MYVLQLGGLFQWSVRQSAEVRSTHFRVSAKLQCDGEEWTNQRRRSSVVAAAAAAAVVLVLVSVKNCPTTGRN